MKWLKITSLFFFSFWVGLIYHSCTFSNNDDSKIALTHKKKLDSLLKLYKEAGKKSYSLDKRVEAIDQFLFGVTKLKEDSLLLEGLKLKANIYSYQGNIKEALCHSHIMLEKALEKKDSVFIGKASYKVGYYNKRIFNYVEAFEYYNQSFKIFRNLQDSIYAGKCLLAMSYIQLEIGDYNTCKTTSVDGLSYVEDSEEHRVVAQLYKIISISFKELGNNKKALLWNDKIFNLTKDSLISAKVSSARIIDYKNAKANILSALKRYSESMRILSNLLKDKYTKRDTNSFAMILNNLAYTKFLENPNNPESEAMFLEALQIRKKEKDLPGQFSSNYRLSQYYTQKQDTTKALQYAKEAYRICQIKGNYQSKFLSLKQITDLDPSSVEHHQLFKKASIDMMDLQKKTQEIYAPTRFENERLLKQNEQKNVQLLQISNRNTVYLLGILLLAVGIGFVLYFFRQRTQYLRQQNKVVQSQAAYETETRISKRLHDELGNDIFQAMLQYQNDPMDANILPKLNSAYTRARDISRENSEFEIGEAYTEELTSMLRNYTQNGIRLVMRGLDKITWDTVDKTIKITLYRVLQELMTNMQKHSQASLVAIIFATDEKSLIVKYSDNGVGIVKEKLNSKNGLRNTQKRIHAVDGTLIFDSEKDKGFKAEIKIPN